MNRGELLLLLGLGVALALLVARPADPPRADLCGPEWTLDPPRPSAGGDLVVTYTHPEPLRYVDLKVDGPVAPGVTLADLALLERRAWTYVVTGLAPGRYQLRLWGGRPHARVSNCQLEVRPAEGTK
ncbi:MAG: hypothetical protein KF718_22900 [Polyangiaceae bacterium]|nr:hypothetical protein [Polyangiaceae bacterium]